MQNKILEFLKRKQEYVSGEDLSSHLKISRQALWKHIQALRDFGYEILAVPHLGYKLASLPDRLFSSEVERGLNTKLIGKKIYYFDHINSTMDMATGLGLKGAPEGTIILSEAQSQGRGRMGREWHSPKYKGIYLSLVLKPAILPNQAPILTLLSAVSICEAVKELTGLDVKIKWPNDIFIGNKKLCGILTELNAEMDQIRFIIIGIGLNINNDKKSLITGSTSLKEETDNTFSRVSILQEILRKIEANYFIFQKSGPKVIADKWRNYALTLGRRVKVAIQKDQIEGQAVDIDTDGSLLLRKDSGIVQKITAGDVVHCR